MGEIGRHAEPKCGKGIEIVAAVPWLAESDVAALQEFLSVFQVSGLEHLSHIACIGFPPRQWVQHVELLDFVRVGRSQWLHHDQTREVWTGAKNKDPMGCADVTSHQSIGRHHGQLTEVRQSVSRFHVHDQCSEVAEKLIESEAQPTFIDF